MSNPVSLLVLTEDRYTAAENLHFAQYLAENLFTACLGGNELYKRIPQVSVHEISCLFKLK